MSGNLDILMADNLDLFKNNPTEKKVRSKLNGLTPWVTVHPCKKCDLQFSLNFFLSGRMKAAHKSDLVTPVNYTNVNEAVEESEEAEIWSEEWAQSDEEEINENSDSVTEEQWSDCLEITVTGKPDNKNVIENETTIPPEVVKLDTENLQEVINLEEANKETTSHKMIVLNSIAKEKNRA